MYWYKSFDQPYIRNKYNSHAIYYTNTEYVHSLHEINDKIMEIDHINLSKLQMYISLYVNIHTLCTFSKRVYHTKIILQKIVQSCIINFDQQHLDIYQVNMVLTVTWYFGLVSFNENDIHCILMQMSLISEIKLYRTGNMSILCSAFWLYCHWIRHQREWNVIFSQIKFCTDKWRTQSKFTLINIYKILKETIIFLYIIYDN